MLLTRHGPSSALRALLVVVALLITGLHAQAAATFSFASDENHDGPTFQDLDVTVPPDVGEGKSPADVSGQVEVDFRVDVNGDTSGGLTVIPATFEFEGVFTKYGVVGTGTNNSGPSVHWWTMDGSYKFTDLSGALLKEVFFENGVFTAFAPDATAISTTATIQSNDPSSILSATLGEGLIDRGISPIGEFAMTDFAFTLTNIRTYPDELPGVDVTDEINGEPQSIMRLGENWIAEGSYSATSTHLTPEPGTALLLLTAGVIALAGIRRRRR